MEGKYYVYELAYPESMGGEVFYVGKGCGERINHHEKDARASYSNSGNPLKIAIIRSIWAKGEQVVKRKIAFFDCEQEAYMYEWAMAYMRCKNSQFVNDGWRREHRVSFVKPKKVLVKIELKPEEAERLLEKLAQHLGISQTSVIEQALRTLARQQGISE